MTKTISRFFLLLSLVASCALAQLSTTSTTLSSAIAASTTTQWCVASATGIVTPSLASSQNGSFLFVVDAGGGGEAAQVTSAGSTSTCFNVRRGQLGTSSNASHASGATVYVGQPATSSGDTSRPFNGALVTRQPNGSCVRASQYTLPVIVTGGLAGTAIGRVYDCINQQWTDVSVQLYESLNGGTQASGTTPSAATAISTIVGGVGGAQSATTGNGAAGGAITNTGGIGGAGGSSSGTGGAGGAIAYIAGAGGGTITGGTGGAATFGAGAGGAGSTAGGTGGALALYSGAAGSGGTGTSGAISIKSGGAAGTSVFATSTAGLTTVASAGTNQNLALQASGTGKVAVNDGTDATKQILMQVSGATASTALTLIAAQTASASVKLPIQTGALPVAYFCGATSGSTTCANTDTGGTARVFGGIATLASNSAVISGISPAFTSTSTYTCVANDLTTRANPVQVANTSSSSITITNTTGASDVINYVCVGY
jgi:hypothetical protein